LEEDFIADLLSFVFVAGVVVAAIISIVVGHSAGVASTRSCMNLLRKREFPISPGAPISQLAINKTPYFFLVSIQKMPMLADIQKQLRAMRQATEKPITKMKKADILAEIERRTGGDGGSGETAPKKKDKAVKKDKTEKEKVKEKAEKPKPKKVVVAESSSDDDSDSDSSVEVVKKKKAPKPEKKSKPVKESSAEDSEKPAKKHKKRVVIEVSESDSD